MKNRPFSSPKKKCPIHRIELHKWGEEDNWKTRVRTNFYQCKICDYETTKYEKF